MSTQTATSQMDVDSPRDWQSEFQHHYNTFENLIVLLEEFVENMDQNNNEDHKLLYRMATRIIMDLGVDFEHLSEMVIVFWILSNAEKQTLLIDKIDAFYTKIINLCSSLQTHYVRTPKLSLIEMNEFLQIERCKFSVNENLSKTYAVKLKLNESLKTIESTLNLAKKYNKTVEIFNNKMDIDNNEIDTGFLQKLPLKNISKLYSFESKIHLRRNNFESALQSINAAIDENFNFYNLQYKNGIGLTKFSNKAELLEFIEKECFEYYIERGLAYSNLGNHLRAFDNDYKATKINPSSIEAWNNRAFSQYELGKYEECINDCNFAINSLNPYEFDRGLLIVNRGLAEYKLKLFTQAINDLNQCILLCPQSRIARETLKKIWDEIVESIHVSANLLGNVPFGVAIIIANYGVGIDFNILDSCNKDSNIVYHDINDF